MNKPLFKEPQEFFLAKQNWKPFTTIISVQARTGPQGNRENSRCVDFAPLVFGLLDVGAIAEPLGGKIRKSFLLHRCHQNFLFPDLYPNLSTFHITDIENLIC